MVVENQAKRVRRTPLTFTVPACSFVVAARTKQFQLNESASEQIEFLDTRWPAAGFRRETNPAQSLRELHYQTTSLKLGKIKHLVFLVFG